MRIDESIIKVRTEKAAPEGYPLYPYCIIPFLPPPGLRFRFVPWYYRVGRLPVLRHNKDCGIEPDIPESL